MRLALLDNIGVDDTRTEVELELSCTDERSLSVAAKHTHMEELLWLPHPRGKALERNVYRRYRITAQELRLVALEYTKRDAEKDVETVQQQDVPHAEQRLFTTPNPINKSVGRARRQAGVPRRGDSP